jgi:hypothetical protein
MAAPSALTTRDEAITLLASEAPKEEGDAAPDVHRVLMTLGWREHLPFELAYVGGERLAETTLAVRLDLRARRWLEILAQLHDLLARQREPHHALADPRDLLRRHIARLPNELVAIANPSKMSSVSSPATSSTSPTSLPSAATTFQPARIMNQETGSATSTVLPLAHSSVGSNRSLNSGVPEYGLNRRRCVSLFRQKATVTCTSRRARA